MVLLLPALSADSAEVGAVRLVDLLWRETSFGFQIVYILGQVVTHILLIVEHLAKLVCWSGLEFVQTQE